MGKCRGLTPLFFCYRKWKWFSFPLYNFAGLEYDDIKQTSVRLKVCDEKGTILSMY